MELESLAWVDDDFNIFLMSLTPVLEIVYTDDNILTAQIADAAFSGELMLTLDTPDKIVSATDFDCVFYS